MGSRKQAAAVGTPLSELATAEPPVSSIAVTSILVIRPKVRYTACVTTPYRALITSRKVCALGALLLSSIARVAKSRICTVAPLAYQKGPLTPYRYATPEDCKSVAAHVQLLTTAAATRPDLTVLPAVLKASEV